MARSLLTAAAVLMASSAGSAAQDTATPAAGLTEEVWAETTVSADALPQDVPAYLGLFRVVWPAGAAYRYQEDVPGIGIDCLVSGEFTTLPERDVLVVRAAAEGVPTPAPAATETAIAPGDCVIAGTDVPREERNSGEGQAEFLSLMIIPGNTLLGEDVPEPLLIDDLGFIYEGQWSGTMDAPAGPLRLGLRRMTLAPGADPLKVSTAGDALFAVTSGTLGFTPLEGLSRVERGVSATSDMPIPVVTGQEALLAPGDAAHAQDGTRLALRNAGDGPATWWLVTVEPIAAEDA
jgi:hypothetical protein